MAAMAETAETAATAATAETAETAGVGGGAGVVVVWGGAPDEMSPAALITRASLDFRGVRPSIEDLDAVTADPTRADATIERYLLDERFGPRVADLFSSVWLTRADVFDTTDANYALPDEIRTLSGMGEEPLQILARVAAEDLPWTELFTGDWTVVNQSVAELYPTDYPAGGSGWQVAHYTDGRPDAGVLSTSGMWWQYMTTTGNANRGRANAISRVFLCHDYLSQTIEVQENLDLLDEEAVNDALRNNGGCVACHHSLDPIGSYLWGFYDERDTNILDFVWYNPEREHLWQTHGGGVPPAWYGVPGGDLADLGHQIAADPRVVECAVQRGFELLLQRPAGLDDVEELARLREDFLADGLTVRALFRAITARSSWRAAPTDDGGAAPWKMVSAGQLVTQIEDLTGWRFTAEGYDVIEFDRYGLRSLAEGGGANYGAAGGAEATPMMVIVLERLAQGAAWYAARADADGASPRLFTEIDFTELPGETAFEAQLEALHYRVLSRPLAADDPLRGELSALWEQLLAAEGDAVSAWAGVLSVLMRHPDFLVY